MVNRFAAVFPLSGTEMPARRSWINQRRKDSNGMNGTTSPWSRFYLLTIAYIYNFVVIKPF
jgi:hypothetical protein